jgi:DNA-binding CsgD family transcriptional regulator
VFIEDGDRKADIRILLPIGACGLAMTVCLLPLFLFAPDAPWSTADSFAALILLKAAFLIGITSHFCIAYITRDAVLQLRPGMLIIAACSSIPACIIVFVADSFALPLPIPCAAWLVAGFGSGLLLNYWARFFTLSWRWQNGAYIAAGVALSSIMYLFAVQLSWVFFVIAQMLLPLLSTLVFTFIYRHAIHVHVSSKTGDPEKRSIEASTNIVSLAFGLLLGIAVFPLLIERHTLQLALVVAVSIGAGGITHLSTNLAIKHYMPFDIPIKITLILVSLTFFIRIITGDGGLTPLICAVFSLAVLTYFESCMFSSLSALASSYREFPLRLFAQGVLVFPAGFALAFGACYATTLESAFPAHLMTYIAMGVAILVAIIALFLPIQSARVQDTQNLDEQDPESLSILRIAHVAGEFDLTTRELDVLTLLVRGRTASYIGEELSISTHTARSHIYHIYQKIGINSQQKLISYIDHIKV